ncbi:regulatory LuxR family protein [Micromonospora pisi]|uniref:Regulatory LuxR family protein n=1 Tax=Micromonospora pisi TaxID=589240 RepID=A0A495JU85_9ACTN|nr:LuxR family transcriptional regulator [Micromonospora pisi]RKR91924.1 regulatory LuxR family protein [Micromonospora pisi]
MSLVERGQELGHLRRLLDESGAGQGRVVVVKGAVASGKSELLLSFAQSAAERGVLVVSAVAERGERGVPLSLLSQLLQDAALPLGAGARLASTMSHIKLVPRPEGSSSAEVVQQVQLMHEAWAALLNHSEDQPLLLLVDDIQYADPESLECLLYFIRRSRSARIMMVLSENDQALQTPPIFHTELLRQSYCHSMRLAMLSQQGVAQVLAERLNWSDGPLAVAFWQATGGNPLLLRALVEDHRAAQEGQPRRQSVEPAAGRAFGHAVLTCLHRSTPPLLELARGLAVLGDPANPGLLSGLLGFEVATTQRLLDELESVGLLADGCFRHPLVPGVVLDDMSPEQCRDLRRRAAERLHHDGASAITVVRQLISADVGEPWMLPVLCEAAEHALSEGEVELAVRSLELAYRSGGGEEQRAKIASALAQAEWRLNPSSAARYFAELAAALREDRLSPRSALALARYQLWHGQHDEAVEVLQRIAGTVDDLDPVTRGMFAATRDWLRCSYPVAAQHLPPVQVDRRLIPPAAGKQMHLAAMLVGVLTRAQDDTALGGAERILRGIQLGDHTVDFIHSILLTLVWAGQSERAARWCEALFREAVARRVPTWQALLATVRAELALRRGNLLTAQRHASTALSYFPLRSWGTALGLPLATQVSAYTAMGKYKEAGEQLNQPVLEAMLHTTAGLHYLYARGRYHLATDSADAALDDFLTCGELMTRWGIDHPGLVPWRLGAAEVYLHWADPARARKLVEDQLVRPNGNQGRTRGMSLRLLAAAQIPQKRLALLKRAVDVLHSCGDRLELARALADLAQAHQELGEFKHAQVIGSQALQQATECRAEPLRRQLTDPEGCTGPVDVRPVRAGGSITALSGAERRVVAFASVGDTNREIASKLHITVSTVEQHLTSAYRKLKVSRRTELPQELRFDVAASA